MFVVRFGGLHTVPGHLCRLNFRLRSNSIGVIDHPQQSNISITTPPEVGVS